MFQRIVLVIALAMSLAGSARAFAADPPAGGAAHADDHGKAPLIPPLSAKTETEAQQQKNAVMHAIWVLIIFLVLLAILYPTAWKNVLAGLKAREARIREDIAAAEAQRAKAEGTLKEYNARLATAESQVRDMIAKAVSDGEKAATEIRMKATQDAEESRQRTMREIEQARKQALSDIYEQAAVLSTQIAEKIIRRNLNPDDQRDLVRRSLDELQTVQR